MTWSGACEALAYAVRELIAIVKLRRDVAVRNNAANDGVGMLLKQLNPKSTDSDKSTASDPGRASGSVDE